MGRTRGSDTRIGVGFVLGTTLLLSTSAGAADAAVDGTGPKSVDPLIRQLSDEDWRVRDKAQEALAAIGEPAEAPLRERLKAPKLDAETRARIEALLAAIEKGSHSGPARVTFKKPATPPGEVLAAIASQAKVPFAPGTENLLADARPFDASFEAAPLWKAVAELCAKTGLAFQSVNKDGQIVLQPASPDAPAAPAAIEGPFLVTLNRIEVNTSRGRDFAGQRPLNARNNPFQTPPCQLYLFAWAEPRLKPLRWFVDAVEECTTDNGKSLTPAGGRFRLGGAIDGRVNNMNETSLTLSGDLEGAQRITRLKLKCRFVLQRQTQKIELPDVLSLRNSTHLVGGFPVEIVHVNKVVEGQYAFELAAKRGDKSPAEWELFKALLDQNPVKVVDADGQPLHTRGGGGSYSPDEVRLTQNLSRQGFGGGKAAGEPVKLVWEFPSEVEQVPVTLEFRDVPLP